MSKSLWQDYGYILRGSLRKKIILNLDRPITPKEMSKKIKSHLSEASRVLLDFAEKGFAVCVNPKSKTGRVYKLTKRGEALRKEIEKLQ